MTSLLTSRKDSGATAQLFGNVELGKMVGLLQTLNEERRITGSKIIYNLAKTKSKGLVPTLNKCPLSL